MAKERVQKILAQSGIGSRRACEEFIRQGRVHVNGVLVSIGASADPDKDNIFFDNKPVSKETCRYVLFYKPRGVLSSTHDVHGTTVRDLVPVPERLYPVGRLDKDAEGLMLLTNDGVLTQHIAHPSFETQKTYRARVQKSITQQDIAAWYKGIRIDDRLVNVDHIHLVNPTTIELTLHEGRKHIVKRLLSAKGYWVTQLIRTRLATLSLGRIRPGQWRDLIPSELQSLKQGLKQLRVR